MAFRPSPRSGYKFSREDSVRGGHLSGASRRAKRDVKQLKRFQRLCEGYCPRCSQWIQGWLYVHPKRKPENQN